MYKYHPQPDITAYELALLMPYFQYFQFHAGYEKITVEAHVYRELNSELKRHFYLV